MHEVIIALGSNLGSRIQFLLDAEAKLVQLPKTTDFKFSSIYQSAPIGCAESPDYLNAVVSCKTELDPYKLLELLQQIENAHHRTRSYPNAPRTLDLDIIFYDNKISSDPILTLPHPRMHERFFVLTPLCEINPNLIHPLLKKTIAELEILLHDKEKLIMLSKEQFVSNKGIDNDRTKNKNT
ncbi:MAG: 2-amino-4-hydroxy-6-hydroxymethyldihydropteridine diphosphokinase [Legionella sp.]|jgi:2-amino-4-hydroxy-6-hydroxymethyldihydropteridine diphosphokinase